MCRIRNHNQPDQITRYVNDGHPKINYYAGLIKHHKKRRGREGISLAMKKSLEDFLGFQVDAFFLEIVLFFREEGIWIREKKKEEKEGEGSPRSPRGRREENRIGKRKK